MLTRQTNFCQDATGHEHDKFIWSQPATRPQHEKTISVNTHYDPNMKISFQLNLKQDPDPTKNIPSNSNPIRAGQNNFRRRTNRSAHENYIWIQPETRCEPHKKPSATQSQYNIFIYFPTQPEPNWKILFEAKPNPTQKTSICNLIPILQKTIETKQNIFRWYVPDPYPTHLDLNQKC